MTSPADVDLVDFLQLLATLRKSAEVEVHCNTSPGLLYIDTGELVEATVNDLTGTAAFNALVRLKATAFSIRNLPAGVPRNIQEPIIALLLQSALETGQPAAASA